MGLIALGGTTFGLAEETMAFYPMLIPIFLEVGYVDGDQVHVIVHAMKAREKFLR